MLTSQSWTETQLPVWFIFCPVCPSLTKYTGPEQILILWFSVLQLKLNTWRLCTIFVQMNCQISSNWPPIWSVRMATALPLQNTLFGEIKSWETSYFLSPTVLTENSRKIGFLIFEEPLSFQNSILGRRDEIIVNNKYTEFHYKANNTLFPDATIKYLNIHRHFLQQLCTQSDI